MAALVALVVWPQIDLAVSGLFFVRGEGFIWRDAFLFKVLAWLAVYGSRALGLLLIAGGLVALWQSRPFLKLSGKTWLFLFFGLLIGPGFVANVVFKDHWGRARPREVMEFGGPAAFSPAFYIRKECSTNCSFVSGDASFGFYLSAFAFVAPARRSRRVFWGAMALGSLFAAARVVIGAHFLSDIIFAAFFMLIINTLLHSAMFGREKTAKCWKNWVGLSPCGRLIKPLKYS